MIRRLDAHLHCVVASQSSNKEYSGKAIARMKHKETHNDTSTRYASQYFVATPISSSIAT